MSIKYTKNQQKVIELLENLDTEITAQNLYIRLKENHLKIGLATVYRTLKYFHLQGIVQERVTPQGESLYRLINKVHSHHLNCINCGQSTILIQENCLIDHSLNKIFSDHKFKLYYHTLEFFGFCENCQNC